MAHYTILLIDYEPRSIERFRDPLTAAGYAVEIATDGISGIEAFHRLNPDMVLVEAMIPKKHGFEVCQELKRTPHGRRTPVIITTGVYKGRKYRTQALHIYGCDEYIEKPIAPEQLLEVVGKFFVSGSPSSSGSSTKGTESTSVTKPAPSAETRPIGVKHAKPASIAPSIVQDDTEDEIMARLDEILPGARPTPAFSEPERIEVAAVEMENPFAQMRTELDAELGSISGPLAFEIAPNLMPILEVSPSDQAVSPSVLEALPNPDPVTPPAPDLATIPLAKDEQPGQVVNFDTKRSRKGRKAEKQGKRGASQGEQNASSPTLVGRPVVDSPVRVAAMALPHGTIAESELESAPGRRGKPVMLWMAVGVVALAVAYLVYPGGDSKPSGNAQAPTPTQEPIVAASAPAVDSAPPVATAPVESVAPTPEPPPPAPEKPKPVLGPVKPPATKKAADRISPATTVAGVPGPRKAAGATPAAPVAPPPQVKTATIDPGVVEPTALAETKATPQEAPAPPVAPEPDARVAGVAVVPDPATAAPTSTIAPGTLIPIDEADTLPVPIARRPPIYSMEARQLRIGGTVIMNVLVNDRGSVDQVVLVSGVPGGDVNEAAIRAAKSWTYRPATKDGVPVKVWKSEQIAFKL